MNGLDVALAVAYMGASFFLQTYSAPFSMVTEDK